MMETSSPRGYWREKTRASSITAAVPEPSSSAPGASATDSVIPPFGTLQRHES
jgi:hypothetical protein